MFGFVFIWALYRHSCVLPCTAHALPSSIHQFLVSRASRASTPEPRQSLGAKRRSRMYAWRLCPGRALGKSSCLPRRRRHKQMNVIKKLFGYRCVFLYNGLLRSLPLPGICRFFILFFSVHLWMASISQCLHFSISHCCLPAGWLMLWFMAELLEPPQHLKHSCRNGDCLDSLEGPMQAQRCLIKDEVEMQVYMPLCAYVKDGE